MREVAVVSAVRTAVGKSRKGLSRTPVRTTCSPQS